MKKLIIALAGIALIAAACGDSASTTTVEPAPATTVTDTFVPEPSGIELGEPLLHNGFLYIDENGVQLVKVLAESFPPQPGGPGLIVEGLDLDTIDGLVTEQGITWSEQPVEILGNLVNDTIFVVESP